MTMASRLHEMNMLMSARSRSSKLGFTSSLPSTLYNPQRGYTLSLTTDDGSGTLDRVRQTFREKDIRYRLLEFDARAKKTGVVKMSMVVEASANLSTEDLTLLVFRDGVQSVSWEEE